MVAARILCQGLIFVVFVSIAPLAHAQRAIPPEKLALIRQLNETLQARNNAAQISEMMSNLLWQSTKQGFEEAVALDPNLTPTQKKQIMERFAAELDATRQQMRELLKQRVDLGTIVEEVSTEVYDELFTTEELKALVDFYRSPVGQKVVALTPRMFAEAAQKTQAKVWPRVQEMLRELLAERLKHYGIKQPPVRTRG